MAQGAMKAATKPAEATPGQTYPQQVSAAAVGAAVADLETAKELIKSIVQKAFHVIIHQGACARTHS